MALVRYGGGIVQMSGSIAGNTFARNRFGNYARARTKPVNPNSTRQNRIRSIMAELTERWYSTLTDAQRIAWATYAAAVAMKNRLGETIYLTGFNHYLRSGCNVLDFAGTYFDAGPVTLTLPDKDPMLSITASEATQLISVSFNDGLDWCTEAGGTMYLLDGRPQNVTRNFFAGPYRGIARIAGIDPGGVASPQTHTGIFTLTEGQKIWVQARINRADGRLSEPFTANIVVAA